MRESNRLSDPAIISVAERCPNLTLMDMHGCNRITDSAVCMNYHGTVLECFFSMYSIEVVVIEIFESFHGCVDVYMQLSSVAEHCKGIRDLFLSFGFSVSDYGLNDIVASCHDSLGKGSIL